MELGMQPGAQEELWGCLMSVGVWCSVPCDMHHAWDLHDGSCAMIVCDQDAPNWSASAGCCTLEMHDPRLTVRAAFMAVVLRAPVVRGLRADEGLPDVGVLLLAGRLAPADDAFLTLASLPLPPFFLRPSNTPRPATIAAPATPATMGTRGRPPLDLLATCLPVGLAGRLRVEGATTRLGAVATGLAAGLGAGAVAAAAGTIGCCVMGAGAGAGAGDAGARGACGGDSAVTFDMKSSVSQRIDATPQKSSHGSHTSTPDEHDFPHCIQFHAALSSNLRRAGLAAGSTCGQQAWVLGQRMNLIQPATLVLNSCRSTKQNKTGTVLMKHCIAQDTADDNSGDDHRTAIREELCPTRHVHA